MAGEVISLGSRLRQRRAELGLTQAQAARELEVARTAYRLWEMEAARPAPDRWRLIAKWLGMSVTAMLLAGELLDEQDAGEVERAAMDAGLPSERWDEQSGLPEGDFFSQERVALAEQVRAGSISAGQAARLRDALGRVQDATASDEERWHPGTFRKRFATNRDAPGLARAALTATAVGIPVQAFEKAALLTSELVTNSVEHSGSDWVEVGITVGADVLHVEVSDRGRQSIRPRTPDAHGGWGLTLIGELATRWGIERQRAGKTMWIELDLTPAP